MFGFQRVTLVLLSLVLGGCEQTPASYAAAPMQSPAGNNTSAPHLATMPQGGLVLSWTKHNETDAALEFSVLAGATWSPPTTIASGSDWFINWADFPSVVPLSADLWAAHWLVRRTGGQYAYDVALSLSLDGGAHWQPAIVPHTDDTATEHGFVSLFPDAGGARLVWLDGRNMMPAGASAHAQHTSHDGGMTLRSVTVLPGGQRVRAAQVDGLVCDCCQTDAAMVGGQPVIVYRNRSEDEIRDIYAAAEIDGRWQPGVAVANDGWQIAGCPVNGPAIAARGTRVGVAWFTAADDNARVRYALSADGAQTFQPAVDIDDAEPVGRVDIELLDDGAVVSWLRPAADGGGELCVRRVTDAGALGPVHVVAGTSTSRQSGFAQMLTHGDVLVFAWTADEGELPRVKTATMAVADL